MKNGTAHISLDIARIMYETNNEELKKVALEVYDEDELIGNFRQILSFDDACDALDIHYGNALKILEEIEIASMASVAMFKLNIIRKALNMKYELSITKNCYTNEGERLALYYPYVSILPDDNKVYNENVIGKIRTDDEDFIVFGGYYHISRYGNLSNFYDGRAYTDANIGFLGCATKEIASYFSRRFGMLIVQAQYADMVKDFEILESKYDII